MATMTGRSADRTFDTRSARNRDRQSELYGAPLGELVRRLTATLGVSQARVARVLGLSPAMLSQLVSARRIKIGDPGVLARLILLDQRCSAEPAPRTAWAVDELLDEVARARLQWSASASRPSRAPAAGPNAVDALRAVAAPRRLAEAAAALRPSFPELADVLSQAAGRGEHAVGRG